MKNKNMTLELQESINERIKKPTVKYYDHKAAPDYIQTSFNHLNQCQFILRGVRRKLIDIKNKEQNGEIKPV